MRIFFDTEFVDDGRTIELISIGLVREDGRTYYAETLEAQALANSTQWLRENVLPHLQQGFALKTRGRIAQDIVEFVGSKPEFWAYFASYDWVALCQLYGTMMGLPKGWPTWVRDLRQLRADMGDPPLPMQEGDAHNALADAIQNLCAWQFLQRRPGVAA